MPSQTSAWRRALADYIRAQAKPVDKYSHQPRLYALACQLATAPELAGIALDDDILYAACWLHDLGVFIGHRPEAPEALAQWDNLAYVLAQAPALLAGWGFPEQKIPAVLAAIAEHLPHAQPSSPEALLLHDADMLEQLGAIGLLRAICKIGRDTRYATFADVMPVIARAATLVGKLRSQAARQAAEPRLALLQHFLLAVQAEAGDGPL